MAEKCKRCDKAPSKTAEGYCLRCRRTKEIIAILGPLETNDSEKTETSESKCQKCGKFPRKVEEYCGRCAKNKDIVAELTKRGVVTESPTPTNTGETCIKCKKRPPKPDQEGYCGYCLRTKEVQALLRGEEGSTTDSEAPKEKVKKSKEVSESEKCPRCEKAKIKEGCEGYCGSCYRTKEVKKTLGKIGSTAPREQLRYEELDPEAGVVRVLGSNLVLMINPLDNSHVLVGELEGEKLIEVTPEAASEFLNKYGLPYKFEPTLKFSFAVPEPGEIPEF